MFLLRKNGEIAKNPLAYTTEIPPLASINLLALYNKQEVCQHWYKIYCEENEKFNSIMNQKQQKMI
jgi:hypothetical protein